MGFVFYFIRYPVGTIRSLLGKDPMGRKIDPNKASSRISRQSPFGGDNSKASCDPVRPVRLVQSALSGKIGNTLTYRQIVSTFRAFMPVDLSRSKAQSPIFIDFFCWHGSGVEENRRSTSWPNQEIDRAEIIVEVWLDRGFRSAKMAEPRVIPF